MAKQILSKTAGIPASILKTLLDITGQKDPEMAVLSTLRDSLEYRLQKSKRTVKNFERKYGMSYKDFVKACKNRKIKKPYSYEVEKDDFDWEVALMLKKKLEKIKQTMPW